MNAIIGKPRIKKYIEELKTDAVFDYTAIEELNEQLKRICKNIMNEAQKYRGFNPNIRVKKKFIERAVKVLGYEQDL